MNNLFRKVLLGGFILLFTQSYLFATVAPTGVYNLGSFSVSSSNGLDSVTNLDFILSGTNDGQDMNMTIDTNTNTAFAVSNNESPCILKLSANDISTASFRLTDINTSENVTDQNVTDILLIGNIIGGGTVQSANTIAGTNAFDEFNSTEFGLSNFAGIDLESIEIHYTEKNSCSGLVFKSFAISDAIAPVVLTAADINHPSAFTATASSNSEINTTWTDATGNTNLPDHYVVMCSISNSFTALVDGTAEFDDNNCQDGSGLQNISHGTGKALWTGLADGTEYFYKIVSSANTGSQIVYKTQTAVAVISATTPNVSDMNITADTVSIPNGDVIPSIAKHSDFGTFDIRLGNKESNFTIGNTGSSALTFSNNPIISIVGADAGSFNVVSNPDASIAPNGTSTFVIAFNPSSEGLKVATVSIANNDPSQSPYTFDINGTGILGYALDIIPTRNGAESGISGLFTVTVRPALASGDPAITGDINYTGTAIDGIDYTLGAVNFTIASGSNTTISLPINNDSALEGTETIIATIWNASVDVITTSSATINVVDNDTFTISSTTLSTGGTTFTEDDADTNHTITTNVASDANVTYVVTSLNTSIITVSQIEISASEDNITLHHEANASGTVNIEVNATFNGVSVSTIFPITVTAVDDDPTFEAIADINATEDDADQNITLVSADVDGDSITYAFTSSDATVVSVPGSGNILTLHYEANASGIVTITVIATANGVSVTQTFDVNVSAVDDAPTLAPIADVTANEDDVNLTVTLTSSDVEGDAITYTYSSSNTSIVMLGLDVSQNLLLDYQDNAFGSVTIEVNATANGLVATQSFEVNVTAVDDAPTLALIANVAANEDDANHTIVLTTTDIDGGGIDYNVTSGNLSLVTVTQVGNDFVLDYQENASGSTDINVTITASGISVTQIVTVTVTAIDDKPIFINIEDMNATEDDSNDTITLVATDAEGDAITYAASSGNNSLVTVLVVGNILTLDYQENAFGVVTIQVDAQTANGTTSQTFDINVSAENDAPTLSVIAPVTANEDDNNLTIALDANDTEGDAITYSVTSSDMSIVKVGISGDNLILDFQKDAHGSVSITVVAIANGQNSPTQTFSVQVNPVNDAPTLETIADVNVTEDANNTVIDLNATDVDGDSISYSYSSSNASLVTLTHVGSQLTLDYIANASGTATIEVNATATGGVATQSFLLTVSPVNDAPTLNAIADVNTTEDHIDTNITLVSLDAEDDNITYTLMSSNASIVSVSHVGNTLTLDYQANAFGVVDINVTASTADGQSAIQSFTVTVNAVDDAPTLDAIANVTATEDDADINITLSSADVENDDINYSITSDNSLVTVSYVGNILTLHYIDNAFGSTTVTVTAVANGLSSVTQSFDVNITAVDDKPTLVAISDIFATEDDVNTTIPLFSNDIESDIITYVVTSSNNAIVNASHTGNILTLDYQENAFGIVEINVTATTVNGSSPTESFTVTVTSVNDNPTLNPITNVSAIEDDANATITLVSADIDGDVITYTYTSSNTSIATASIVGNTLTLDYQDNAFGIVTIDVNATANGQSAIQSFDVNITAVDDAPTLEAIADVNASEDDIDRNITLVGVDVDGVIAYTVTSSNTSIVTVSETGGILTLDYQTNASGLVTIEVNATSDGQSVTQSFEVSVLPVNDAPILGAFPDLNATEDDSNTTIVLISIDADNDVVTYLATSLNTSLIQVAIDNNGSNDLLILDYQENASGIVTIEVNAIANGQSTIQRFDVNISARDDAPTLGAIADINATEDDINLSITLVGTDVDGDSITYTVTSSNASIVMASNIDDILTLDYQENASGLVTINVTASANGQSVIDSFDVNVSAVDDAPTLEALADINATADDVNATITLIGNDVEDDNITYSVISSNPSLVIASITGNILTLDYQENTHGTVSIEVNASTANGKSSIQTFTVVIANPLVLDTIGDMNATEDDINKNIILASQSADGDTIAYTVTSSNTSIITASITGNVLTLDYQENANGTVRIDLIATVNNVVTTQSFNVLVQAVNDEPIITIASTLTTSEDASKVLSFTFSDVDNDTVTAIQAIAPIKGSITINGTDITYVQGANYTGIDTFTLTFSDGNGFSMNKIITVVNTFDNCLNISNPNQLDTDNDGAGNACDSDDDNDGVLDTNDALPLNPNESVDTDGDGIGNNADSDNDNDGILDIDEYKWGFNPLDASDGGNADADNDGVSNQDEIKAGSDPLDASDTKIPTIKKYIPIFIGDLMIMIPDPKNTK